MNGTAKIRFVLTALLAASGIVLGGCGDETTDSGDETVDAATVNVKMGEFYVVATPASVPAGDVELHVTNEGPEDVHELVVLKTDLPADKLPLDAAGDVDEEATGIEAMGEVEDVASGAEAHLDLKLAAGKYVLICNIAQMEPDNTIEHHYTEGMFTSFTVE